MQHHYGRHGPHAWRRQRARRFLHLMALPPREMQLAIVRIQITFAYGERIIVVDPNEQDQNEQNQPRNRADLPITVDATAVATNHNKAGDVASQLLIYAEIDAQEYAQQNFKRFVQPLETEIRDYADGRVRKLFRDYPDLVKQAAIEGVKIADLQAGYSSAFISLYRENNKGRVVDKAIQSFQRSAYQDAEQKRDLVEPHLTYQAVIRVLERLGLNSNVQPGYLEQINQLVGLYKRTYQEAVNWLLTEQEVNGRSDRPRQFQ